MTEYRGIRRCVSRENVAQDVEDWRIAVDEGVRAGMMCRERKGEQARDLLRGVVSSEKKAEVTIQAASRFLFLGSWQEVRRVYGVAQARAITDPSPSRIRAIIHQRFQM